MTRCHPYFTPVQGRQYQKYQHRRLEYYLAVVLTIPNIPSGQICLFDAWYHLMLMMVAMIVTFKEGIHVTSSSLTRYMHP